jgi:hypothetical protein
MLSILLGAVFSVVTFAPAVEGSKVLVFTTLVCTAKTQETPFQMK